MTLKFKNTFTCLHVPNQRKLIFPCCDYVSITCVWPVESLDGVVLGINLQLTFHFHRLYSRIKQPLQDPNADCAIFAHTCQLVTFHVAKLNEPYLVFMLGYCGNTLLRDYICWAVMIWEEREIIHVHIVKSAALQLITQSLLHQYLKSIRLEHGIRLKNLLHFIKKTYSSFDSTTFPPWCILLKKALLLFADRLESFIVLFMESVSVYLSLN